MDEVSTVHLVASGSFLMGVFVDDPEGASALSQKLYEDYDIRDALVIPVTAGMELPEPFCLEDG